MQLRRLSEYASVACSVEGPAREAQAEKYSDTVLRMRCYQGTLQNRRAWTVRLRFMLSLSS